MDNFTDTVVLENSDRRLVAVEEAKMSGQPVESEGANESVIVPVPVAQKLLDDASMEDIYVSPSGHTYAAHLESYHEKIKDPSFVHETNEEKAAAHAANSAEYQRRREEEDRELREKMREGYDPSLAVQQANLQRALEHEQKSIEYMGVRRERANDAKTIDEVVAEAKDALGDKALEDSEGRLESVMGAVAKPVADEKMVSQVLETKDKVVETVIPYEDKTMSFDELDKRDRPGVEILRGASSPEELVEQTAYAQAAAGNPTPAAAEAVEEVTDKATKRAGKNKPAAEALDEAIEEAAGGTSDEMPENPKE